MTEGWIVALLSLACFGSFAWAVKGHFRSEQSVSLGMQILSLASILGMAWFLFRVEQGDLISSWPVAVIPMIIALPLFWSAILATRRRRLTLAFERDIPSFVQQNGPYRWIRHPFYTAYILFWIATSLVTIGFIHWIVPAILVITYITAARREERKFARSVLAQSYQVYRDRTGMLLPLPWKRSKEGKQVLHHSDVVDRG